MLINEMILFYHVVHLKSFSQAAEKLRVSKAYVSKHISLLEKELKTRLLLRNTRSLTLTESGEVLYLQCEKLFEIAEQGYESIANIRAKPTGTLKISMPPALAVHLLAKPLADYQLRYPEVNLNIVLDNKQVDLVQQGYDLAIRAADLADSNLVALRLCMLNSYLCATPRYLQKNGKINQLDQLSKHHFAIYGSATPIQTLEFIRDQRPYPVTIQGKFQSNQLDLIAKMVMADCCVAVLPEFMVESAVAEKKLIICLEKYKFSPKPLYILYPQREFIPLKVRLFIDLLKTYFAKYK